MNASPQRTTDADDVRRQVADEVYRKLAFLSFAIWTLGTFLYFITYAAPVARPVLPAVQGMLGSLVLAGLPWLFRRQVTDWVLARRPGGHSPAARDRAA